MKLYRYEVVTSLCLPHTGILVALDNIFPDDEDMVLKLCAFFEDNLYAPNEEVWSSELDTMSFFTEKGNRKFNKAIKKIKQAFNAKRVKVVCIQTELDRVDPLYQDEYQVLIERSSFN